MVSFENIERSKNEGSKIMDKMEKIKIFPSKPPQHLMYGKLSNQMPKLTKTIMSPLTTMPSKKMMIINNSSGASNMNKNIPLMSSAKPNCPSPPTQNLTTIPLHKNNQQQQQKTSEMLAMQQTHASLQLQQQQQQVKLNKSNGLTETPNPTPTPTNNNTNASYKSGRILIGDVHPYITCSLCHGYLIKATTIVECLHTFCHSCLMKHLARDKQCPECNMSINKSKTNIKYDATIQSIVYKLVPGLYQKELLRRRAFYKQRPNEARLATPEERGDDTENLIFSPFDLISISLEYAEKQQLTKVDLKDNNMQLQQPKFLNCPAVFKVEHLKKFIFNKFSINSNKFNVEISYKVKTIVLPEHYTLMDVAYIYTWKKEAPMQFFYRIIRKSSSVDELPEVSLRRSPPTTIVVKDKVADEKTMSNHKQQNSSVKNDIKTMQSSVIESKKPQHLQPIKIKLSVSNNNVSIINSDSSIAKSPRVSENEKKQQKHSTPTVVNDTKGESLPAKAVNNKKDEYEFDDDLEQQKLGFLNTFQLTAKKVLEPKKNEVKTSPKFERPTSKDSFLSFMNKRKSKETPKTLAKQCKFDDTKSSSKDGSKFLFTKTADGHKITFDMSPMPLGSKPSLKDVKNDILMLKKASETKTVKPTTADTKDLMMNIQAAEKSSEKSSENLLIKPKKLPFLLPKQQTPTPTIPHQQKNVSDVKMPVTPVTPSPTTFLHVKKPENRKDFASKEISVTKINDPSQHLQVYGPKSPVKHPQIENKSSGGFLQPLPPKPKTNNNAMQPPLMNILKPYGSPIKLPKNIPDNMQTPYGCRTPFYVPSSPSYTPNFDTKSQFKYASPNAYASFMQSMFSAPTSPKLSPPENSMTKVNENVAKKRSAMSTSGGDHSSAKKRALSPAVPVEESKTLSILNKISFPSSLSVTLTNEQEENKKEQMRTSKQSTVNNNIEIIKISEEKESKKSTQSQVSAASPTEKKSSEQQTKAMPDLKSIECVSSKVSGKSSTSNNPFPPPASKGPGQKEPTDFQRAFMESIISIGKQNAEKNLALKKKDVKEDMKMSNTNINMKDIEKISKSSLDGSELRKNISLTPPPPKMIEKSSTQKSLTPPPLSQDPSILAANAMQLNLMLLNAAYPDLAQLQKTLMLETFRQNLAIHQLQQQQKVQQQQQISSAQEQPTPAKSSQNSSDTKS